MKKTATTNNIFSIIWAGFLITFLIMAYLSYQSVDTKLHRYSFVAPQSVVLGAIVERYGTKETVNLFEEFENLTSTHNKNVYELEKSIQREALTMTVLNGLSAFFCLLGLFAQNWVTAIEALKKNQ